MLKYSTHLTGVLFAMFFVWALVGEYRDHGIAGVLIILVGGMLIYLAIHFIFVLLERKARNDRSSV